MSSKYPVLLGDSVLCTEDVVNGELLFALLMTLPPLLVAAFAYTFVWCVNHKHITTGNTVCSIIASCLVAVTYLILAFHFIGMENAWAVVADFCTHVSTMETAFQIDVEQGACVTQGCASTLDVAPNNCSAMETARVEGSCAFDGWCLRWAWQDNADVCTQFGAATCTVECDDTWTAVMQTTFTFPNTRTLIYDTRESTGCATGGECYDRLTSTYGVVGQPFEMWVSGDEASFTIERRTNVPESPFTPLLVSTFFFAAATYLGLFCLCAIAIHAGIVRCLTSPTSSQWCCWCVPSCITLDCRPDRKAGVPNPCCGPCTVLDP